MFQLKFRIVDDIPKIKKMSTQDFNENIKSLYGMIELRFNNNSIGYIHDNKISHEEMELGLFQNDSLTFWINNLLESINLLEKSNYVILAITGNDHWYIEYKKEGSAIYVSKAKPGGLETDKNTSCSFPIISNKGLEVEFYNKSEKVVKNIEFSEIDWGPVEISFSEYKAKVKTVAKQFLEEIEEKIGNISQCDTVKEISNKYSEISV